jgi:antitoxin component YwqK of YwqJK toxin-antitoxin module
MQYMKKLRVVFALFLVCNFSLLAQQVNQNDANGKRQGVWKGTYEKSKRVRYEGTFDHGKETGTFKYFQDDKTSTLMATRAFNADGSCYTTFFDEKGKKVNEGKEVNKLREGEWKFYFAGKDIVMQSETYSKGKLHGLKKIYYDNASLAEEINYQNGQKNGAYKKYMVSGKVIEQSTYKNDELNGPATFFDEGGQMVAKGQFANNNKSGKWQYYDKGKVVKTVDEATKKVELAPRVDRKQ